MKFMKLGAKPDQFQADDGGNIRYVATELAADLVITVHDVKFYLHKFPLLSKCLKLQKLVASKNDDINDEIEIHDIPGGPPSFEICAKFCYGMIVTLNAYNVVAARCAAEYLEMYETVDKGNLIYKIDVFLNSSIFRSWKDSIIVLQTTKSFLPWSEELKLLSQGLDSISSKASMNPSKVDWSYTYNNRDKLLLLENQNDKQWNGVMKQHVVPKDWWVEDLCELSGDLFKMVLMTIKAKGRIDSDIIGESLIAYTLRRLPSFNLGTIQEVDFVKYRYLVDTVTWLLPTEKHCVPCSFLLKVLQASIMLECGEKCKMELVRRIGQQLDEATVSDFLIRSGSGETTLLDIDIVYNLVEKFTTQEHDIDPRDTDASQTKVARLVDNYLAEAARDSSLPLDKFFDLAQMVSNFPRPKHDGIYRAIDMYLKEHPGMSKSDKKRICRLMDCRKLSTEACAHAVQNERLPLRVVVQVLFFEQTRAATLAHGGCNSTPNLKALVHRGSYGSSSSAATSSEEDWDGDQKSKELVKSSDSGSHVKKIGGKKGKNILSKIWSSKEREGDNSSSDTSQSPGSNSVLEERKEDPAELKKGERVMHNEILKKFYEQRDAADVKSLGR